MPQAKVLKLPASSVLIPHPSGHIGEQLSVISILTHSYTQWHSLVRFNKMSMADRNDD